MNDKLKQIWNIVNSENINQIKVFYVTNNDLSLECKVHNYNDKISEFSNISQILKKDISLQIVGLENYSKIRTGILLELPEDVKNSKSVVVLEKMFENRDKNTVVAEISLKNLALLVREHRNYIFFSNVRNYKGLNKINKGMVETFDKHPKNFWFYNNGITIVCRDYKVKKVLEKDACLFEIFAPQIVNGCQTASTILNCIDVLSIPEREKVDGSILVKIIKDLKEEKRKEITKYTNSQTAVTGKDFFALKDFHRLLQSNFSIIGYDYEIQSNAKKYEKKAYKGNPKYDILFDASFKKKNTLSAKDVVQLYVACLHQLPAKAKNVGEFMPGGQYYDKIFDSSTPEDPRFYIIPYGVFYYFKKIHQYSSNKISPDKWKGSLLFISSVFFKIISKKYFNGENKYLSTEFIDKCEEIITNEASFVKLIAVTTDTIIDFYKDSKIKEIINENLPKFLKATIDSNNIVKDILESKIEDNLS